MAFDKIIDHKNQTF